MRPKLTDIFLIKRLPPIPTDASERKKKTIFQLKKYILEMNVGWTDTWAAWSNFSYSLLCDDVEFIISFETYMLSTLQQLLEQMKILVLRFAIIYQNCNALVQMKKSRILHFCRKLEDFVSDPFSRAKCRILNADRNSLFGGLCWVHSCLYLIISHVSKLIGYFVIRKREQICVRGDAKFDTIGHPWPRVDLMCGGGVWAGCWFQCWRWPAGPPVTCSTPWTPVPASCSATSWTTPSTSPASTSQTRSMRWEHRNFNITSAATLASSESLTSLVPTYTCVSGFRYRYRSVRQVYFHMFPAHVWQVYICIMYIVGTYCHMSNIQFARRCAATYKSTGDNVRGMYVTGILERWWQIWQVCLCNSFTVTWSRAGGQRCCAAVRTRPAIPSPRPNNSRSRRAWTRRPWRQASETPRTASSTSVSRHRTCQTPPRQWMRENGWDTEMNATHCASAHEWDSSQDRQYFCAKTAGDGIPAVNLRFFMNCSVWNNGVIFVLCSVGIRINALNSVVWHWLAPDM